MNLVDLSVFFNKFAIGIEPTHPILWYRVYIIGLLSIPATREYYIYITNE